MVLTLNMKTEIKKYILAKKKVEARTSNRKTTLRKKTVGYRIGKINETQRIYLKNYVTISQDN